MATEELASASALARKDSEGDAAGLAQEGANEKVAATQDATVATAASDHEAGTKADEMARCRRCRAEVPISDAVAMPKFRLDLRYTCKPCWALNTTITRHGIDIGKALSEEDAIAFFVEAKEQRMNGSENRLSYQDARALLKQKMVVAASRIDSHGEDGEYQPLSYWELKGYDTSRIEKLASKRTHPILGDTFLIDISKQSTHFVNTVTEERLLNMESAAMERKKAASAASSVPQTAPSAPDLDLPTLVDAAAGKKRKTPEEKAAAQELAKAQRAEDKKRRKLESVACSALAKLLPQLKKARERLQTTVEKAMSVKTVSLSADDDRIIGEASETLEQAISKGMAMLSDAANGKSLADLPASDLKNEKELQQVIKDGNNAVRVAQAFVRANKENAAAAKKNKERKG